MSRKAAQKQSTMSYSMNDVTPNTEIREIIARAPEAFESADYYHRFVYLLDIMLNKSKSIESKKTQLKNEMIIEQRAQPGNLTTVERDQAERGFRSLAQFIKDSSVPEKHLVKAIKKNYSKHQQKLARILCHSIVEEIKLEADSFTESGIKNQLKRYEKLSKSCSEYVKARERKGLVMPEQKILCLFYDDEQIVQLKKTADAEKTMDHSKHAQDGELDEVNNDNKSQTGAGTSLALRNELKRGNKEDDGDYRTSTKKEKMQQGAAEKRTENVQRNFHDEKTMESEEVMRVPKYSEGKTQLAAQTKSPIKLSEYLRIPSEPRPPRADTWQDMSGSVVAANGNTVANQRNVFAQALMPPFRSNKAKVADRSTKNSSPFKQNLLQSSSPNIKIDSRIVDQNDFRENINGTSQFSNRSSLLSFYTSQTSPPGSEKFFSPTTPQTDVAHQENTILQPNDFPQRMSFNHSNESQNGENPNITIGSFTKADMSGFVKQQYRDMEFGTTRSKLFYEFCAGTAQQVADSNIVHQNSPITIIQSEAFIQNGIEDGRMLEVKIEKVKKTVDQKLTPSESLNIIQSYEKQVSSDRSISRNYIDANDVILNLPTISFEQQNQSEDQPNATEINSPKIQKAELLPGSASNLLDGIPAQNFGPLNHIDIQDTHAESQVDNKLFEIEQQVQPPAIDFSLCSRCSSANHGTEICPHKLQNLTPTTLGVQMCAHPNGEKETHLLPPLPSTSIQGYSSEILAQLFQGNNLYFLNQATIQQNLLAINKLLIDNSSILPKPGNNFFPFHHDVRTNENPTQPGLHSLPESASTSRLTDNQIKNGIETGVSLASFIPPAQMDSHSSQRLFSNLISPLTLPSYAQLLQQSNQSQQPVTPALPLLNPLLYQLLQDPSFNLSALRLNQIFWNMNSVQGTATLLPPMSTATLLQPQIQMQEHCKLNQLGMQDARQMQPEPTPRTTYPLNPILQLQPPK